MTTDIFANWKNKKFVVADYDLISEPDIVVILTDIEFWAQHVDELITWCEQNGGVIKGMTVGFDTNEQLMLFALRWA